MIAPWRMRSTVTPLCSLRHGGQRLHGTSPGGRGDQCSGRQEGQRDRRTGRDVGSRSSRSDGCGLLRPAARAFDLVGDVDAAHTYAQHAINVATGLDSTGVKRRFLDLAHEIAPAAGTSPNARELRAQLCLAAGVTEPDQWQQGNR